MARPRRSVDERYGVLMNQRLILRGDCATFVVDELRRENAALIRREEEHLLLILDMESKIDQLLALVADLQKQES